VQVTELQKKSEDENLERVVQRNPWLKMGGYCNDHNAILSCELVARDQTMSADLETLQRHTRRMCIYTAEDLRECVSYRDIINSDRYMFCIFLTAMRLISSLSEW